MSFPNRENGRSDFPPEERRPYPGRPTNRGRRRSAATSFLVVGAVVVEALTAAVGGGVGPGIVRVTVGALAAIAAFLAVRRRWARGAASRRRVPSG